MTPGTLLAGGIFAGLISDYTGGRATTCCVMLVVAAPMVSCHTGSKPVTRLSPAPAPLSHSCLPPPERRDEPVTHPAGIRAGIDSRAQMLLGRMSSSRGWGGIEEALTTENTL